MQRVLIENYSMTSGSLWNYYRDEVNDSADKMKIILRYITIKQ